jgi:hypothetical protein
MTVILKAAVRIALACGPVAAAGGCDAAPVGPPDHASDAVEALPLRSGYYVSSDTPCAEASSATLHLMHDDGQGYGGFTTPPYDCGFVRIERVGRSRYRVEEACGDAYGDGDEPVVASSMYEVVSDTHYRAVRDDGWASESRRCPRRELPAPWRDADVDAYVD